MANILLTGVAGFIGSRVAQMLAQRDDTIVGIDNINDYYDVRLKYARLRDLLGVTTDENEMDFDREYQSTIFHNFKFYIK